MTLIHLGIVHYLGRGVSQDYAVKNMGGETEAAWRHVPKELHDKVKADDTDMMSAENAEEVRKKRKAFLAKWRLRCRGVADSLEEAGERLFTFLRYPPQQWKSLRTTNAIERLHGGEDEPWPKAA